MADLTTYSDLLSEINSWNHRQDLSTKGPVFVKIVEARLNRELWVQETIVRDITIAPSADEAYEQLPSDFRKLHSIRFNTDPVVDPKFATPQYIEKLRKRFMHAGGTPEWYSIANKQILFERIPTGEPELEIASYIKIPALNNTTQTTNAILETYPDLYLFGCLAQASPFLDDDRRLVAWESKFGNAIDMANAASKEAEQSPGPLVVRPTRWFG